MDNVQRVATVQGVYGQCPGSPWTLSSESTDFVPGFLPYTIFRACWTQVSYRCPLHTYKAIQVQWHDTNPAVVREMSGAINKGKQD